MPRATRRAAKAAASATEEEAQSPAAAEQEAAAEPVADEGSGSDAAGSGSDAEEPAAAPEASGSDAEDAGDADNAEDAGEAEEPAAAPEAEVPAAAGITAEDQAGLMAALESRKRSLEDAPAAPAGAAAAAAAPAPPAAKRVALDPESDEFAIKLLVSNNVAGGVIGAGGRTVGELQTRTGAKLKISGQHDLFPGSSERTILVRGGLDAVRAAVMEVLQLVFVGDLPAGSPAPEQVAAKFAVPHAAAGWCIGKGGATITALQQSTAARFDVSQRTELPERTITLSGAPDNVRAATNALLDGMAQERANHHYENMTPVYGGAAPPPGHWRPPPGPPMGMGAPPMGPPGGAGGPPGTIVIPVDDNSAGAVVGRGGATVTEMQQTTGARIKVSGRGDFLPGTSNRSVTIMGPPQAVAAAQALVMAKIQEGGGAPMMPMPMGGGGPMGPPMGMPGMGMPGMPGMPGMGMPGMGMPGMGMPGMGMPGMGMPGMGMPGMGGPPPMMPPGGPPPPPPPQWGGGGAPYGGPPQQQPPYGGGQWGGGRGW